MRPGLVVIGGSYAGLYTVAAAREHGWSEPIHLVTEEPWLPYERPPLSKSFLLDDTLAQPPALRGTAFYEQHEVQTRTGTRVVDVDPGARTVELSDGTRLPYRRLALATGATARRLALAGGDLPGVHTLRSLADAHTVRQRLSRVEDVVILGAGFIGMELASALAATGRRVTVLEAADRVMARALGPVVANWLHTRHHAHGVRILPCTTATALLAGPGGVCAVRTTTGEVIAAQLVIVGVGASVPTEVAQSAGVAVRGGVLVDASMRTNVPGIVAAGDCTVHPNAYAAQPIRLESVQNATDQGRVAGATVAGVAAALGSVPWFWSDQCGVKLQLAGLWRPGLHEAIRGQVDEGRFSVVYLDDEDTVTAVHSVNRPGEHMLGRRLVAGRIRLPAAVVADPSTDLKALLAPAISGAS